MRDLFVQLLNVWTPNGEAAYHYEMFTNASSFGDAIVHAFRGGRAPVVYVAAHGAAQSIHGFHDNDIRRAKVRHALRRAKASQRQRGIYFGTCLFHSAENAEFLFMNTPRVSWLAGYDPSVDWMDSSVLDLFFLRHYLFPEPGKGSAKPHTHQDRAKYAAAKVLKNMRTLALSTGFHVFVRRHAGGMRDLILEET